VASTKAFTCQLTALFLIACIWQVRETLEPAKSMMLVDQLLKLPAVIEDVLRRDAIYEDLTKFCSAPTDFLISGAAASHFPSARRRAQAERDFLHSAEGTGGEMKHRPNR